MAEAEELRKGAFARRLQKKQGMTHYAGTMVGTTAPALKVLGVAEGWPAEVTWLPGA